LQAILEQSLSQQEHLQSPPITPLHYHILCSSLPPRPRYLHK
jgi:hypothetical protein